MTTTTPTRYDSLEPLIALFQEDGYKVDEKDTSEHTDRRVYMVTWSDGFWLDLDNYGVTVVIGASKSGYGGAWGKGATLDDAKREFRKQGGGLARGYTVVHFDDVTLFLGISGMGGYRWLGNEPDVEQFGPRGRRES